MTNITIDRCAGRRAISPLIYGVNEYGLKVDAARFMAEVKPPLRRWGGNLTSRYNWQNDVRNHGSDYFFINSKHEAGGALLPDESAANRFIEANQAAGSASLLVAPGSGYVSNDDEQACGFSVAKYGPQQATALPWHPDAGNGIDLAGILVAGNDPLDTSIQVGPTFVRDWVTYLAGRYGGAAAGGVRFYNLDNEPDLWFETHRDIRPVAVGYDDLAALASDYGAAIKDADPGAAVLGPALGTFVSYLYSAHANQANAIPAGDVDRQAHGGQIFVEWYLQQMAAYEAAHGRRVLDYLDLHYYPQSDAPIAIYAGGDRNEVGGPATQAARLASTRSLWDPAYVDDSWIRWDVDTGGVIRLIPRMREWIARNYPGTKIAITEYGWSALDDMNGALAQADVLGIFGREGVDLAALFNADFRPDDPGAYAFRMYLNYDGAGRGFGDVSVQTASSDPSQVAAFGAERSTDRVLTVIAINKTGAAVPAEFSLANCTPLAQAHVYQYGPANLNAIVRLPDLAMPPAGAALNVNLPASSITLIEL